MVQRRLQSERTMAEHLLRSDLALLIQRSANALKALDDGRPIDAHLIANSVMITADITRWNLAIDLLPILEAK
jgi:hypothetical protein